MANQIIATIRPGYVLEFAGARYTITGSMKLRGRYLYTAKTADGCKISIAREGLLQAQREGSARIISAQ